MRRLVFQKAIVYDGSDHDGPDDNNANDNDDGKSDEEEDDDDASLHDDAADLALDHDLRYSMILFYSNDSCRLMSM